MFRSLWDKLRGKQPEHEPMPEDSPGATRRMSFDSAIPQETREEKEHEAQSERDRPDGPDRQQTEG